MYTDSSHGGSVPEVAYGKVLRDAMFHAQALAAHNKHRKVNTTHLLLAIIGEDVFGKHILDRLVKEGGKKLTDLALELDCRRNTSDVMMIKRELPFSRRAKAALNQAQKLAIQLGDEECNLGTDHVLAGIASLKRDTARNLLYKYGITYEKIVSMMLDVLEMHFSAVMDEPHA